MANGPSYALVPVRGNLPARQSPYAGQSRADAESGPAGAAPSMELVNKITVLSDRAQVERFLPDILGRALARSWIDTGFRRAFADDPKGTLAAHRIHLPASIRIDVVTEGQTRPMVIVSETGAAGTAARRLLYLQLVMVAGK